MKIRLTQALVVCAILAWSDVVPAADSMNSKERLNRTPEQIIQALSKHYGHRYAGSYLQALALMVRADNEGVDAVRPILSKALEKPQKMKSGSHLSGQLAFCELARTYPPARDRVLTAANLGLKNGRPASEMPFHNQMSDAVFMACPILCEAGRLTENSMYDEVAWNHLQRIRTFCLRKDGLYRHSPLDEAAWGRGNGFPALGLSMVLETMPAA
ncbi:MAG: glycoside hydrolase family 88 protein, partial [Verrucomicrobiota bacterium]